MEEKAADGLLFSCVIHQLKFRLLSVKCESRTDSPSSPGRPGVDGFFFLHGLIFSLRREAGFTLKAPCVRSKLTPHHEEETQPVSVRVCVSDRILTGPKARTMIIPNESHSSMEYRELILLCYVRAVVCARV